MKRLHAAWLSLALATGCASTLPFSSSFPNGGDRVSQALARAKSTPATAQRAVVVGVADAPRSVFAYDLEARRMLFRAPAPVSGVPSAAGELIVVPEASRVTVRRLSDGAVLHELMLDGMQLIGADGDSTTSAIVLSTGGTMNARSRLVILQGERVSSDRQVGRALGAPAVLGGLAFVPHQRVHVSVIEPSGAELARVRIQEDVASQALAHGGDVYFGQRGFYRFDPQLALGSKENAAYWRLTLKNKLPGAPPLLADSSMPAPPIESALHRVSLRFAPTSAPDGKLALQDDSLYLAFYRQLFALAPDGASARWVYETPSDVVGAHALLGGLVAVETSGVVTGLDAQGRPSFHAELNLVPVAARIRAERLPLSAAGAEAEPLAVQLDRAARNPDTRLVPARAFAAQLLGAVEDDQAARALIALCGESATPTRVREDACTALARRSTPSDAVLAALSVHSNFLEGRLAPPLSALAMAAQRAGDRRASADLVTHLFDPATPGDALAPILRALAALGDAQVGQQIGAYLRLYHADSGDEQLEEVLTAAMEAQAVLDAQRARATLEQIANDQFARVGVRAAAQRKLSELGPAPAEERESDGREVASQATTGSESAQAPVVPVEQGPPAHLTTQHIDDALSPVRPKLSRCVREAPEHPASARLVLVIGGDGDVIDVRVLPESLKSCIDPWVRGTRFPATKYGRRAVMSYSVSR